MSKKQNIDITKGGAPLDDLGRDILNRINNSVKEDFPGVKGKLFNDFKSPIEIRHTKHTTLSWVIENFSSLKFNKKEIDYLLENADLSAEFGGGRETILDLAIKWKSWINLDSKQWGILIDKCAGGEYKDEYSPAIGQALMSSSTNFSLDNWIALIEKTDSKYFNIFTYRYHSVIITNMLVVEPELLKNSLVIEILINKLDPEELKKGGAGEDVLRRAAGREMFDFVLKFVEKMGVEWATETANKLKKDLSDYSADYLEKIIDIVRVGHDVDKVTVKTKLGKVGNKI